MTQTDEPKAGSKVTEKESNRRLLYKWTRYSSSKLQRVEESLLSSLKTPLESSFVDIGKCVGNDDRIRTISMNTSSPNMPVLLLHGLGSGIGLWVLNLDDIAEYRPVYAIDILGFGRSSHPTFKMRAVEIEEQFVASIEAWRASVGLERMYILGHSMGGYFACSYALVHPERVAGLVLADPWGFPEIPSQLEQNRALRLLEFTGRGMNWYPLTIMRMMGPNAAWMFRHVRADLTSRFENITSCEKDISNYLHQINAQVPSGERAFCLMQKFFGWPMNPMLNRVGQIDATIPMTFIYGSRSWIDSKSGDVTQLKRPASIVNVKIIENASHNLYADFPDLFNRHVNDTCESYDNLLAKRKDIAKSTSTDI